MQRFPPVTYFHAVWPQLRPHSNWEISSVISRITYHFYTAVLPSISLSICFSLLCVCEDRVCTIWVFLTSFFISTIPYIIVLSLNFMCMKEKFRRIMQPKSQNVKFLVTLRKYWHIDSRRKNDSCCPWADGGKTQMTENTGNEWWLGMRVERLKVYSWRDRCGWQDT